MIIAKSSDEQAARNFTKKNANGMQRCGFDQARGEGRSLGMEMLCQKSVQLKGILIPVIGSEFV